MGQTSIEYLFTDKKAVKPTREWADLLRAGKSKYANCRVVSYTRVKNLNSDWKHEYVQFIVEEESTKDRARVYAERGNEVDLDWVTYGPVESLQSGSKGLNDLPLPLTSLIFGGEAGDDTNRRPTVLEIAEILAATTVVGGGYQFYGHSCFWYAYTSYDAVKRHFGKWATEKSWRWFNIGGAGNAGVRDAIGLGWPMLFKFYYVGDAKWFKKERETNMNFLDGETREVVDAQYVVDRVATNLQQHESRCQYLRSLEHQGLQATDAQVQQLLLDSEETAKEQADKSVDWTKEFDELISRLVEKVYTDPEAPKCLEYYNSFEVPPQLNVQSFELTLQGKEADDVIELTANALKIVVARILTMVSKNK